MADILRPQTNEQAVSGTANTIFDGVFIRFVNRDTAAALITKFEGGNTSVNTSVTILGGSVLYMEKAPADTVITDGANVVASFVKIRGQ